MYSTEVFFSSTFLDLRSRRRDLFESTWRMPGTFPRGMENEAAPSSGLLEHCMRMVSQCQIYVGMVDSRYGSRCTGPFGSLSLTHHEFIQATQLELYRVVCISKTIQVSEVDDRAGVDALRAEMNLRYPIWFNKRNPMELVSQVMAALARAREEVNSRAYLFLELDRARLEPASEQLRVRRILAHAAGYKDASHFWLTPHYFKGPNVTVCPCCLPSRARDILLKDQNWYSDGILHFCADDGQLPSLPQRVVT